MKNIYAPPAVNISRATYMYGYDQSSNEIPDDFRIILRLADKEIVFTADDIRAL